MVELSDKQQKILSYIKHSVQSKGYPPSVREIGQAVGLRSSSTVHAHLAKLEDAGVIRRDPTKPRAIEIIDESSWRKKTLIPVPHIGRVTAGQPILAVENVETTYPLPVELIGRDEQVFMLDVSGDSMINAGILDGDYILVKTTPVADNGDIVVAMIEEEATVKRFYKENGHYRLQPENDTMEPIYANDVFIVGKVVGLFRRL